MRPSRAAIGVVASAFTWCELASAQTAADKATAESLFTEARELIKQGSVARACPKLVESHRLDPALGTLLYLGDCYERQGLTASAWATFTEAIALARTVRQPEREKAAQDRVDALAPRLVRLTVRVLPEAQVDGLVVTRDGAPLPRAQWDSALPIDPGTHRVEASAPGRAPFVESVDARAGSLVVTIAPLAPLAPAPAASAPSGQGRRTAAIVVGGVGGLAIVGGTYFGLRTLSQWSQAKDRCVDGACDHDGQEASSAAHRAATVSTVSFAVGAIALGAATALWLTAPTAEQRVGLVVSPGGVRVEGTFR